MTRTEQKLRKANIDLTGVTISGSEVEIYVENSETATKRKMNQISKVLNWGGYRTGFGGWVLRKGYTGNGDFMDAASRWHY
jgi:hypothetical protein